jgi:hypothetical protein
MLYFLDTGFWGTYPQWGSFIVGVVTLMLAIIGYLTKKVNDAEKIVRELKIQNSSLSEQNAILTESVAIDKQRLAHETKVNILELRPVFKKEDQQPFASQNQIQLVLKNHGTKADEIKIENGAKDGDRWSIVQYPENKAVNGGNIAILITSTDPHFEGVKFDLTYYDEHDIKHVQLVEKKYGGNFQIQSPAQ